MSTLSPLLEGCTQVSVPGNDGYLLSVHQNFRFFATQNDAAYASRHKLPGALRSRFLEVQVPEMDASELATVILKRVVDVLPGTTAVGPRLCITRDLADTMSAVVISLRQLQQKITMREIVKWQRRMQCAIHGSGDGDTAGAWAMTLSGLLCPRVQYDDKEVKRIEETIFGTFRSIVPGGVSGASAHAFDRASSQLTTAANSRESVLLVGPTSCKSRMVQMWAQRTPPPAMLPRSCSLGRDLIVVHLTVDTEAVDLVGQMVPLSSMSGIEEVLRNLVDARRRCAILGASHFSSSIEDSRLCEEQMTRIDAALQALQLGVEGTVRVVDETDGARGVVDVAVNIGHGESKSAVLESPSDDDDTGILGNHDESSTSSDSDTASRAFEPAGAVERRAFVRMASSSEDDDPVRELHDAHEGRGSGAGSHEPVRIETLGRERRRSSVRSSASGGESDPVRIDDAALLPPRAPAPLLRASSLVTHVVELAAREQCVPDDATAVSNNVAELCLSALSCISVLVSKFKDSVLNTYVQRAAKIFEKCKVSSASVFAFRDGPVTRAAKLGYAVLLEDFDLPSQAATERLNGLLEPTPSFSVTEDADSLTEKGSSIEVATDFRLFATVHRASESSPVRLSPAARSRFTEIAVPSYTDDELYNIFENELARAGSPGDSGCALQSAGDADQCRAATNCLRKLKGLVDVRHHAMDVTGGEKLEVGLRHLRVLLRIADFARSQQRESSVVVRVIVGSKFFLADEMEFKDATTMLNVWLGVLGDDMLAQRDRERLTDVYGPPNSDLDKSLFVVEDGLRALRCRYGDVVVGSGDSMLPPSISERMSQTITPTVVINMSCAFAVLATGSPLLMEGPPGVGKTALVSQLAKLFGADVERINCSGSMTKEQLFGGIVPRIVKGKRTFEFEDGNLVRAIRRHADKPPRFILLDEINLAPCGVLDAIAPLLERHATEFTVPGSGESLPLRDVRVFATMNPSSIGGNRSQLPRSILGMFSKFVLDGYSEDEERRIALDLFASRGLAVPAVGDASMMALPLKLLQELFDIQRDIVEQMRMRAIGSSQSDGGFNLRDLMKLCSVFYGNLVDMREHFPELPMHEVQVIAARKFAELVYCGRFGDTGDQSRVRAIIDARVPAPERVARSAGGDAVVDIRTRHVLSIGDIFLTRGDVATSRTGTGLVHTPELIRNLELLAAATQSKLPVLLEGPTCAGKTSLVVELARLAQRELLVLHLNQNSEPSDFIGQWLPETVSSSTKLLEVKHDEMCRAACSYLLVSVFPLRDLNDRDRFAVVSAMECCVRVGVAIAEGVDAAAKCISDYALKLVSIRDSETPVLQMCRGGLQGLLAAAELLATQVQSLASGRGAIGFTFVESELVRALRNGHYILLDNINSAPPDAVERLNSLLEEEPVLNMFEQSSGGLLVRGNGIDPEARIFATANLEREHSNNLSAAVLNRVLRIRLRAVDDGIESKVAQTHAVYAIASKLMHGDNRMALVVAQFHGELKKHIKCGDVSLPRGSQMSFRNVQYACTAAAYFKEKRKLSSTVSATWGIYRSYFSLFSDADARKIALRTLVRCCDNIVGMKVLPAPALANVLSERVVDGDDCEITGDALGLVEAAVRLEKAVCAHVIRWAAENIAATHAAPDMSQWKSFTAFLRRFMSSVFMHVYVEAQSRDLADTLESEDFVRWSDALARLTLSSIDSIKVDVSECADAVASLVRNFLAGTSILEAPWRIKHCKTVHSSASFLVESLTGILPNQLGISIDAVAVKLHVVTSVSEDIELLSRLATGDACASQAALERELDSLQRRGALRAVQRASMLKFCDLYSYDLAGELEKRGILRSVYAEHVVLLYWRSVKWRCHCRTPAALQKHRRAGSTRFDLRAAKAVDADLCGIECLKFLQSVAQNLLGAIAACDMKTEEAKHDMVPISAELPVSQVLVDHSSGRVQELRKELILRRALHTGIKDQLARILLRTVADLPATVLAAPELRVLTSEVVRREAAVVDLAADVELAARGLEVRKNAQAAIEQRLVDLEHSATQCTVELQRVVRQCGESTTKFGEHSVMQWLQYYLDDAQVSSHKSCVLGLENCRLRADDSSHWDMLVRVGVELNVLSPLWCWHALWYSLYFFEPWRRVCESQRNKLEVRFVCLGPQSAADAALFTSSECEVIAIFVASAAAPDVAALMVLDRRAAKRKVTISKYYCSASSAGMSAAERAFLEELMSDSGYCFGIRDALHEFDVADSDMERVDCDTPVSGVLPWIMCAGIVVQLVSTDDSKPKVEVKTVVSNTVIEWYATEKFSLEKKLVNPRSTATNESPRRVAMRAFWGLKHILMERVDRVSLLPYCTSVTGIDVNSLARSCAQRLEEVCPSVAGAAILDLCRFSAQCKIQTLLVGIEVERRVQSAGIERMGQRFVAAVDCILGAKRLADVSCDVAIARAKFDACRALVAMRSSERSLVDIVIATFEDVACLFEFSDMGVVPLAKVSSSLLRTLRSKIVSGENPEAVLTKLGLSVRAQRAQGLEQIFNGIDVECFALDPDAGVPGPPVSATTVVTQSNSGVVAPRLPTSHPESNVIAQLDGVVSQAQEIWDKCALVSPRPHRIFALVRGILVSARTCTVSLTRNRVSEVDAVCQLRILRRDVAVAELELNEFCRKSAVAEAVPEVLGLVKQFADIVARYPGLLGGVVGVEVPEVIRPEGIRNMCLLSSMSITHLSWRRWFAIAGNFADEVDVRKRALQMRELSNLASFLDDEVSSRCELSCDASDLCSASSERWQTVYKRAAMKFSECLAAAVECHSNCFVPVVRSTLSDFSRLDEYPALSNTFEFVRGALARRRAMASVLDGSHGVSVSTSSLSLLPSDVFLLFTVDMEAAGGATESAMNFIASYQRLLKCEISVEAKLEQELSVDLPDSGALVDSVPRNIVRYSKFLCRDRIGPGLAFVARIVAKECHSFYERLVGENSICEVLSSLADLPAVQLWSCLALAQAARLALKYILEDVVGKWDIVKISRESGAAEKRCYAIAAKLQECRAACAGDEKRNDELQKLTASYRDVQAQAAAEIDTVRKKVAGDIGTACDEFFRAASFRSPTTAKDLPVDESFSWLRPLFAGQCPDGMVPPSSGDVEARYEGAKAAVGNLEASCELAMAVTKLLRLVVAGTRLAIRTSPHVSACVEYFATKENQVDAHEAIKNGRLTGSAVRDTCQRIFEKCAVLPCNIKDLHELLSDAVSQRQDAHLKSRTATGEFMSEVFSTSCAYILAVQPHSDMLLNFVERNSLAQLDSTAAKERLLQLECMLPGLVKSCARVLPAMVSGVIVDAYSAMQDTIHAASKLSKFASSGYVTRLLIGLLSELEGVQSMNDTFLSSVRTFKESLSTMVSSIDIRVLVGTSAEGGAGFDRSLPEFVTAMSTLKIVREQSDVLARQLRQLTPADRASNFRKLLKGAVRQLEHELLRVCVDCAVRSVKSVEMSSSIGESPAVCFGDVFDLPLFAKRFRRPHDELNTGDTQVELMKKFFPFHLRATICMQAAELVLRSSLTLFACELESGEQLAQGVVKKCNAARDKLRMEANSESAQRLDSFVDELLVGDDGVMNEVVKKCWGLIVSEASGFLSEHGVASKLNRCYSESLLACDAWRAAALAYVNARADARNTRLEAIAAAEFKRQEALASDAAAFDVAHAKWRESVDEIRGIVANFMRDITLLIGSPDADDGSYDHSTCTLSFEKCQRCAGSDLLSDFLSRPALPDVLRELAEAPVLELRQRRVILCNMAIRKKGWLHEGAAWVGGWVGFKSSAIETFKIGVDAKLGHATVNVAEMKLKECVFGLRDDARKKLAVYADLKSIDPVVMKLGIAQSNGKTWVFRASDGTELEVDADVRRLYALKDADAATPRLVLRDMKVCADQARARLGEIAGRLDAIRKPTPPPRSLGTERMSEVRAHLSQARDDDMTALQQSPAWHACDKVKSAVESAMRSITSASSDIARAANEGGGGCHRGEDIAGEKYRGGDNTGIIAEDAEAWQDRSIGGGGGGGGGAEAVLLACNHAVVSKFLEERIRVILTEHKKAKESIERFLHELVPQVEASGGNSFFDQKITAFANPDMLAAKKRLYSEGANTQLGLVCKKFHELICHASVIRAAEALSLENVNAAINCVSDFANILQSELGIGVPKATDLLASISKSKKSRIATLERARQMLAVQEFVQRDSDGGDVPGRLGNLFGVVQMDRSDVVVPLQAHDVAGVLCVSCSQKACEFDFGVTISLGTDADAVIKDALERCLVLQNDSDRAAVVDVSSTRLKAPFHLNLLMDGPLSIPAHESKRIVCTVDRSFAGRFEGMVLIRSTSGEELLSVAIVCTLEAAALEFVPAPPEISFGDCLVKTRATTQLRCKSLNSIPVNCRIVVENDPAAGNIVRALTGAIRVEPFSTGVFQLELMAGPTPSSVDARAVIYCGSASVIVRYAVKGCTRAPVLSVYDATDVGNIVPVGECIFCDVEFGFTGERCIELRNGAAGTTMMCALTVVGAVDCSISIGGQSSISVLSGEHRRVRIGVNCSKLGVHSCSVSFMYCDVTLKIPLIVTCGTSALEVLSKPVLLGGLPRLLVADLYALQGQTGLLNEVHGEVRIRNVGDVACVLTCDGVGGFTVRPSSIRVPRGQTVSAMVSLPLFRLASQAVPLRLFIGSSASGRVLEATTSLCIVRGDLVVAPFEYIGTIVEGGTREARTCVENAGDGDLVLELRVTSSLPCPISLQGAAPDGSLALRLGPRQRATVVLECRAIGTSGHVRAVLHVSCVGGAAELVGGVLHESNCKVCHGSSCQVLCREILLFGVVCGATDVVARPALPKIPWLRTGAVPAWEMFCFEHCCESRSPRTSCTLAIAPLSILTGQIVTEKGIDEIGRAVAGRNAEALGPTFARVACDLLKGRAPTDEGAPEVRDCFQSLADAMSHDRVEVGGRLRWLAFCLASDSDRQALCSSLTFGSDLSRNARTVAMCMSASIGGDQMEHARLIEWVCKCWYPHSRSRVDVVDACQRTMQLLECAIGGRHSGCAQLLRLGHGFIDAVRRGAGDSETKILELMGSEASDAHGLVAISRCLQARGAVTVEVMCQLTIACGSKSTHKLLQQLHNGSGSDMLCAMCEVSMLPGWGRASSVVPAAVGVLRQLLPLLTEKASVGLMCGIATAAGMTKASNVARLVADLINTPASAATFGRCLALLMDAIVGDNDRDIRGGAFIRTRSGERCLFNLSEAVQSMTERTGRMEQHAKTAAHEVLQEWMRAKNSGLYRLFCTATRVVEALITSARVQKIIRERFNAVIAALHGILLLGDVSFSKLVGYITGTSTCAGFAVFEHQFQHTALLKAFAVFSNLQTPRSAADFITTTTEVRKWPGFVLLEQVVQRKCYCDTEVAFLLVRRFTSDVREGERCERNARKLVAMIGQRTDVRLEDFAGIDEVPFSVHVKTAARLVALAAVCSRSAGRDCMRGIVRAVRELATCAISDEMTVAARDTIVFGAIAAAELTGENPLDGMVGICDFVQGISLAALASRGLLSAGTDGEVVDTYSSPRGTRSSGDSIVYAAAPEILPTATTESVVTRGPAGIAPQAVVSSDRARLAIAEFRKLASSVAERMKLLEPELLYLRSPSNRFSLRRIVELLGDISITSTVWRQGFGGLCSCGKYSKEWRSIDVQVVLQFVIHGICLVRIGEAVALCVGFGATALGAAARATETVRDALCRIPVRDPVAAVLGEGILAAIYALGGSTAGAVDEFEEWDPAGAFDDGALVIEDQENDTREATPAVSAGVPMSVVSQAVASVESSSAANDLTGKITSAMRSPDDILKFDVADFEVVADGAADDASGTGATAHGRFAFDRQASAARLARLSGLGELPLTPSALLVAPSKIVSTVGVGAGDNGEAVSIGSKVVLALDRRTIAAQLAKVDCEEMYAKAGKRQRRGKNAAAGRVGDREVLTRKPEKWTYQKLADTAIIMRYTDMVVKACRTRIDEHTLGGIEFCVLIDNSGSMSPFANQMYETVVLLMESLRRLECRFSVYRFGNKAKGTSTKAPQICMKGPEDPFTPEVGQRVLELLTFDEGSYLASAVEAVASGLWPRGLARGRDAAERKHRYMLLVTDALSTELVAETGAQNLADLPDSYGFKYAVLHIRKDAVTERESALRTAAGELYRAIGVSAAEIDALPQMVGQLVTAAFGQAALDLAARPAPDGLVVDRQSMLTVYTESKSGDGSARAFRKPVFVERSVGTTTTAASGRAVLFAASGGAEEVEPAGSSEAALPDAAAKTIDERKDVADCCVQLRRALQSMRRSSPEVLKDATRAWNVATQAASAVVTDLTDVFENAVFPCNKFTRRRADVNGSQLYLPGLIKAVCTDFNYKKFFCKKTGGGKREYSVCILVDTSSSMFGAPANSSCTALVILVAALAQAGIDNVSIMSFGSGVRLLKTEDEAWDGAVAWSVLSALNDMEDYASNLATCDVNAVRAASLLLEAGAARGSKKIFVLSDGFSSTPSKIRATASALNIDVVGIHVGMDRTDIHKSYSQWIFAAVPSALPDAFRCMFIEGASGAHALDEVVQEEVFNRRVLALGSTERMQTLFDAIESESVFGKLKDALRGEREASISGGSGPGIVTMDLCFVIDVTGSMQKYMPIVRGNMTDICTSVKAAVLEKHPDLCLYIRYALLAFRDITDAPAERFVRLDFPPSLVTAASRATDAGLRERIDAGETANINAVKQLVRVGCCCWVSRGHALLYCACAGQRDSCRWRWGRSRGCARRTYPGVRILVVLDGQICGANYRRPTAWAAVLCSR